jgi:hypothetical protein
MAIFIHETGIVTQLFQDVESVEAFNQKYPNFSGRGVFVIQAAIGQLWDGKTLTDPPKPDPLPPVLTKSQFEGLLASVQIGSMLFEDVWNTIEAGAKAAGLGGDAAQLDLYAKLRAQRVSLQFRLDVTLGYVVALAPVIRAIAGEDLTAATVTAAWHRAAGL